MVDGFQSIREAAAVEVAVAGGEFAPVLPDPVLRLFRDRKHPATGASGGAGQPQFEQPPAGFRQRSRGGQRQRQQQFIRTAAGADRQEIRPVPLPEGFRGVGMDRGAQAQLRQVVAAEFGVGEYYQKHGAVNRFELLNRHLNRVVDICKELGFKPIMWSDMFYRLGSKNNDYYDTDAVVPESAIAQIPDVALCYWDYYHTDEQFYAGMLEGHRKMGKEVVFAGGIWTWSGILPHVRKTNATMYPALRACLKAGIGTVLATSWGDDGCETDYRLALNQLPIYSEHVWLGEDCTRAEVERMGERLTGLSEACFNAMGAFYADDDDRRPGKGLFYCDPLYPLTEGLWDLTGYREGLEEGIKTLERHLDDSRCEYAWLAMRIALEKLNWVNELRPAYLRGDKAVVLTMANEKLPAMRELYVKMMSVWREQWESGRKRNGWETICARLGAVIARLDDVQRILLRWADGTIECVEELDETPLPASRLCGRQDYHTMSFPQFR